MAKALFLDLLAPAFGLAGATFPEKIEGLAFGPPLPDGRLLLLVASDNDFFPAQPTKIFAFAIEPSSLPGWQPQILDTRLAFLNDAKLRLGLKNSDDQGARLDVRIEIDKDGALLAAGEARCITSTTDRVVDSPAVNLGGGNPWRVIGTWTVR